MGSVARKMKTSLSYWNKIMTKRDQELMLMALEFLASVLKEQRIAQSNGFAERSAVQDEDDMQSRLIQRRCRA